MRGKRGIESVRGLVVDWYSFGIFAGPGKGHGRWRRRRMLRERLREKEKTIAFLTARVLFAYCFHSWLPKFCLADSGLVRFLVRCRGGYYWATCVEARDMNGS